MPRLARRTAVLLAFALALGVLAGAPTPSLAADSSPVDDRAARAEQVRQAELAFANSVLDDRPDLFAAFLDEHAIFVGSSGVTRGKAAVVEAWKGYFGEKRPYFEWHPEIVELSGDGELGLSRGPWTYRGVGADGNPVEASGTFNSVWRRQSDGTWRVVFDAGCGACPVCGG